MSHASALSCHARTLRRIATDAGLCACAAIATTTRTITTTTITGWRVRLGMSD